MLRVIPVDDRNARAFKGVILPGAYRLLTSGASFAYGCADASEAVGALVCTIKELAGNIESIYVPERLRRNGIGGLLLRNAVEDCAELGVTTFRARYVLSGSERDAMEGLLRGCGFADFRDGCEYCTATVGELARTKIVTNAGYAPEGVSLFSSLPTHMIGGMFARFAESFGGESGEYMKNNLRPDISAAYVRGGMILGAVVFTGRPDSPTLSAAFTLPAARGALPSLVSAAMSAAVKKYRPESEIRFAALTPESREMISLLLEGREVRTTAERFAVRRG